MIPSTEPQTPQPGMEAGPQGKLRVAAVGDLHVGETSDRPHRALFERVHEDADVLCLCGDLTNFGKTREVEILLEDLPAVPLWYSNVTGGYAEVAQNVEFGWNSVPLYYEISK